MIAPPARDVQHRAFGGDLAEGAVGAHEANQEKPMNANLDIRTPDDIRWMGLSIYEMTPDQLFEAFRKLALWAWESDPPDYGWDPRAGTDRG